MRNLKLAIALCASLIALVCPAAAQSYAKISQPWFMQGKIAGGVSVTATTPSPATTLPTPGQQAWVCNTGSNDAYLAFGSANTVASSTTTGSWLKAGTCWTYDLNAFSTLQTFMAAVTATSTTTLTVETGIGTGPYQLSTSGGGGGGSVNVAQWGGTAIAGSTAWGTAPTAGSIVPNMNVNCVVGCAGGTTSNASSAVATSSTNGASVAYLYGFNSTTWDQLQVDASKSLKVNVITSALPTGAGTAANQATIITALTTVNTNLTTLNTTAGNPLATQAISNIIGGVGLNATPSLANGSGVVPTQGGSVLSATNPLPTQLSQANAAASATNPVPVQISQGNAAASSANPIPVQSKTSFGAAQLTPTVINISSSGTNNVIASSGSTTIKVYGMFMSCVSSVVVTVENGATPFTGPMTLTTFFLPVQAEPWFTTTTSNALNFNLGTGVQCSGTVFAIQS